MFHSCLVTFTCKVVSTIRGIPFVARSTFVFKNQRHYITVMYIWTVMHEPLIYSALFLIFPHLQV
jgi:hypothetical protein